MKIVELLQKIEESDANLSSELNESGIFSHHTITRYSIERIRDLLNEAEYARMIGCWIDFMGSKPTDTHPIDSYSGEAVDYDEFFHYFSKRDEAWTLSSLAGMLSSPKGRKQIGHYLIKGICDQYQGSYDPHFLTGLGPALWVVNVHHDQPVTVINGLCQYLNYYLER